jgi:hypothetical protein
MRTNAYLVTRGDAESQLANGTREPPQEPPREPPRERVLSVRFTLTGLALQNSFVMQTYVEQLRYYFDVNTRETGVSGARPSERFVVDPMCNTLRRLLNLSFDLDETDPANLSRREWLDLSFAFGRVRRNKDRPDLPDGFQAWFRSTDTKHNIVVVMPDPAPSEPTSDVLMIQYTGFLRFRTYATPGGRCQTVRSSVPGSSVPGSAPPARALATGATWDDIPFDLKVRCLKLARELERAERYRARVLCFQFRGHIALADHQELQQALEQWQNLYTQEHEPGAQQPILRRLETRLGAVFDAVFRPDGADELNQPERPAFRVQAFRQVSSIAGLRFLEVRATSADGLHRMRLHLMVGAPDYPLIDNGTLTRIIFRYYGPQRFLTFDDYDIHADRGGMVLEWLPQHPLAAPRGLDDPRVFEDWIFP